MRLTYHELLLFFFFNDTATTEIYTLSLHDALPISRGQRRVAHRPLPVSHHDHPPRGAAPYGAAAVRSEEHTSELQSHSDLVCRLLLEKKKKNGKPPGRARNKTIPEPTDTIDGRSPS